MTRDRVHMKKRLLSLLAVAGVATAGLTALPVVGVGGEPAAQAQASASQQVCNRGSAGSGSVRVITTAGSQYNVFPGSCSGTNVYGWRPHYGTSAYAYRTGYSYVAHWRGDNVYESTLYGPIYIGQVYQTP